MATEPAMQDSGERRTFASGAVRDRGTFKPRPDLISPHANLREGAWLAIGAQKYALRNWEKGINISECLASLIRHVEAYKLGLQDEDHMAAIRTNAGFILHYEEEIKAGRMDPAIDDMPHYWSQPARLAPGAVLEPLVVSPEPIIDVVKRKTTALVRKVDSDAWPGLGVGPCPVKTPVIGEDRYKDLYPHPTFYITGPMRGIKDYNFPAFDGAAKRARAKGWGVISPAEEDREHGVEAPADQGVLDKQKRENIIDKTTIRGDCEILLNLDKGRGDGVILLPGWRRSTGARAEIALALWLGLTFINSTTLERVPRNLVEQELFCQHRQAFSNE